MADMAFFIFGILLLFRVLHAFILLHFPRNNMLIHQLLDNLQI